MQMHWTRIWLNHNRVGYGTCFCIFNDENINFFCYERDKEKKSKKVKRREPNIELETETTTDKAVGIPKLWHRALAIVESKFCSIVQPSPYMDIVDIFSESIYICKFHIYFRYCLSKFAYSELKSLLRRVEFIWHANETDSNRKVCEASSLSTWKCLGNIIRLFSLCKRVPMKWQRIEFEHSVNGKSKRGSISYVL